MYDAQIGRFHTQDRFGELDLSITPYSYAGNDPINNLDLNGDFKLPFHLQIKYPHLTNLLKNQVPKIVWNGAVIKQLLAHSGMSYNQIVNDFQFGKGPEISPNSVISGGLFTPGKTMENSLQVSDWNILDRLEELAKNGSKQDLDAMTFFTLVTIMHEYVHYGRNKRGLSRLLYGGGEAGRAFEEKAFGMVIEDFDQGGKHGFNHSAKGYIKNGGNTIGFLNDPSLFFLNTYTGGNSSGEKGSNIKKRKVIDDDKRVKPKS